MKIFVPLKRVPDPYAKVKPLSDGSGFDSAAVKFEINPFDEIALEAAIRLKEAGVVTEVTVLTIGASPCEEQLRKGLAMGADRATLIQFEGNIDSLSIAQELAEHVLQAGAQIVLMGKQATDEDNGQVPGMLAGILGWNYVAYASKLDFTGDTLIASRETDNGEETVSTSLPVVISADLRLAEPRYIALPGIIKARSKPLETIQPFTHLESRVNQLKLESVPPRKPGGKVSTAAELIEQLSSKGVLA